MASCQGVWPSSTIIVNKGWVLDAALALLGLEVDGVVEAVIAAPRDLMASSGGCCVRWGAIGATTSSARAARVALAVGRKGCDED